MAEGGSFIVAGFVVNMDYQNAAQQVYVYESLVVLKRRTMQ